MSTKQNKPSKKQSEVEIEEEIVRYVKREGGRSIKLEVTSIRGWTDRLVLLDGLVLFIEVKKPGGRISPHQKRIIADLQARGYNATVVWSLEEFVAYVASITRLSTEDD